MLELGERAKEVKDQPTTAAVGVDGFGERSEADAALVKVVDDLDQVLQRPREAVELPDHQRVALRIERRQAVSSGRSRNLLVAFSWNSSAAGATERVELQPGSGPAYSRGIADDHQTYLWLYVDCFTTFLRSG